MEENKIQDAEIVSSEIPVKQTPKESDPETAPAQETAAIPEGKKPETAAEQTTAEPPKVIVEKERGLAYYVGLALLTVLAVVFFFVPGISLVYLVSIAAALSAPVAWIFAALLSVIIWFIFKLKIKGFKKSFYWYIGLCLLISIILVSLSVLTSYQVLSGIFALLIGGNT